MEKGADLLAGRYSRVRQLGKGAYGSVAQYRDAVTGETVAIKKLQAIEDEQDARQVLREVLILKHCSHPNLLRLKGFFLEESGSRLQVYVITELMDFDLATAIRLSRSAMRREHVQFIMFQVFLGVSYLHASRVVHRDLKPNNILLDDCCQVRLCDFGLARGLASGADCSQTEYVVTRYYRAPEVMLCSRK